MCCLCEMHIFLLIFGISEMLMKQVPHLGPVEVLEYWYWRSNEGRAPPFGAQVVNWLEGPGTEQLRAQWGIGDSTRASQALQQKHEEIESQHSVSTWPSAPTIGHAPSLFPLPPRCS